MMAVNIGPVVLQWSMLSALLAAIAGYIALRFRLRGTAEASPVASAASTALLIWLLVWKLSVYIFDPSAVQDGLRSLLYFNGGVRGAILASVLAVLCLVYANWRGQVPRHTYIDSLLVAILSGCAAYGLLKFAVGEGHRLTTGVMTLWCTAAALYGLTRLRFVPIRQSAQLALVAAIGASLLWTAAANGWERTSAAAAPGVGLKKGQLAPDFELESLDGERIRLSDYRGRTVVLNFWATWCPPCQAEMPYLQRFNEDFGAEDAVVLGVNATTTEVSRVVVRAWVREWGLTFPIVYDGEGEVGRTYRVTAYPATYIIGPDGVIRQKHQGPMNYEQLKQATGIR